MSSTAAPLDPTSLAASSRTRTLFCGLGSGAFAGLVGNFALTASGGFPGTPIQPLHVSLAALGTSVVGAFVLRALSARTPRAGAILVGAASALAALATLKVGLTASEVHFVGTAAWVHFTVAVCGSGALGLSLRGTSTSGRGTVPMSIAAVATSLAAQLADLNATHVYNPAWPPHARYHGVLFICLLTGVGLLALALTWTPRTRLSSVVSGGLLAIAWVSFFAALLVPETSSWPDGMNHAMPVNGNLILGAVVLALGVGGWWRAKSDPALRGHR